MESLEGEGFAEADGADLLCWQSSGGISGTARGIISITGRYVGGFKHRKRRTYCNWKVR